MRKKQTWIMALLAILLLITAGCGKSPDSIKDNLVTPTAPATELTGKTAADASLNSLRQAMVGTPQLFAVAYFGFQNNWDSDIPVDPLEAMQKNAYWLCQDLPFLLEIPEDRVIGEGGDLFCIVPLDEQATVAVSKGIWDDKNGEYIYEDSLYYSESGAPILLWCNTDWEPDTQVYINGPSGEVFWYPGTDDNGCATPLCNDNGDSLFYDFSLYRDLLMARHSGMKDSGWAMPTKESLICTTWSWCGFLKDGRDVSYRVTFDEDTLSVRWNDGIDEQDHEYLHAAWELSYDEGFAILSIDFREMAGVLHYNLLYHEEYELLYVAMDAVQEEMPIGWEPLYRYLTREVAPEPTGMIGEWEMVWMELEDDRSYAEPGERTIEIVSAASGSLLMSYISQEFPENNFYNELLTIDMRQMHTFCGNDEWVADVGYVGPWDTTYTVTLTSDDVLIKQNYFLLDGAPTVSYEYFYRIGEGLEYDPEEGNEEDPYAYAISQGWYIPDFSELVDTFWLSWNGYALDLLDDSVPDDNGGRAILYDVDEIGAYTESYSGSWRYEGGMLHLSLVPANGNGVFVDDSFPVLVLDGQLWIGRNSNGLGLPHFYSDMLADVLDQPKG